MVKAEEEKKQYGQRLHARLLRWQEIRRTQMNVASNLLLTLGIAMCAYIDRKYETSTSDYIRYSFYSAVVTVFFGSLLTITRLLDYKFTARKVGAEWKKHKATSDGDIKKYDDEMKCYRNKYKCMECATWWALSLQIVSLITTVVLYSFCLK